MKLTFVICSLFLLMSFKNANSQNPIKEFFQLSGPEKSWVFGHIFVAHKAYKITNEARKETFKIITDSLLDQFPNGGKVDAFRHIYWMAILTDKLGEKRARSLGKAHERGNYKYYLKEKKEEGVVPDSLSGVMDLTNNELGIQIGKQEAGNNQSAIKLKVIESIKLGKAVILKRNSFGELVTCDDVVVPFTREWSLPYCLIKSNAGP